VELKEYSYQYAFLKAEQKEWMDEGDRMNVRELEKDIFRLRKKALQDICATEQDMLDFLKLEDGIENVS
jgi:hypothetical protein